MPTFALKNTLNYLPCIKTLNGKIISINSTFIDFTGYFEKDVLNKNISDIFDLLRINIDSNLDSINLERDYFLFTRTLEAKQVNISVTKNNSTNETKYIFMKNPDFRIDGKFPLFSALCSDNTMGVAIYSVPDMLLLKANQVYLDFLDKPFNKKENSFGKKTKQFITGWQGSISEKIWNTILTTGKTYHTNEYAYHGFGRGTTYWNETLVPIFENNQLKYVIEMALDITESVLNRKLVEEQSRIIFEQKEKFKAIIENISDPVFIIDKNKNYSMLNNASKSHFPKITKLGESFELAKFYNSQGIEEPLENMPAYKVMNGKRVENYKLTMKIHDQFTYFNVNATPIFDSKGNFTMGVICCHDITKRVNYEQSIKNKKDALYNIINTLDLPLVRLSYPDLKIIEFNKKANYLMNELYKCGNYDLKKLKLGENIFDILPSFLPDIKKCIEQLDKTKKITYINNFKIAIGNKVSYMNLIFQPLLNSKGNIKELFLIGLDITKEVRKCKELETVLSMQEEFFSFISHEFKTPLTVSMSAIQIIELICKDELSERMKKYLSKIKQSSLQQLRLVNNLLDLTRAEAGYLKINKKNDDIVVMTKAIIDSISLYASQKNIKLHFSSSIPSLVMAIDDEKFERILLNLLSNSIKFTPEGKSVYVDVSKQEDNICIRVTDEGVGIPREKQKIIFDRFGQVNNNLTRKAEGTGIGLCLVKLLVNNLGGEISVKSVEGKGSSFEISLPITNIIENNVKSSKFDLMDNRLIHTVNIEFSNIYFD